MTEGPTHYEGWTCERCKHYRIETSVNNVTQEYCIIDGWKVIAPMHTPNWCPFLKHAITMHVMEECS